MRCMYGLPANLPVAWRFNCVPSPKPNGRIHLKNWQTLPADEFATKMTTAQRIRNLQSIWANLLEVSDKFYGIETDLEEGYESAQSGLQTIAATSRAIPVDPRVHRERAKFYMHMASYELELADTAENNNETLKALRKLQDALPGLPIESEQIND